MVALLVRGRHVIGFGINQFRYVRDRSYFDCSLHAEIDLLRKSKPSDIKRNNIFVYRFNNSTDESARVPKCSLPCPLCQHELQKAGANKITAMNNDGEIISFKNRELVSLSSAPSRITHHFIRAKASNASKKFQASSFILR